MWGLVRKADYVPYSGSESLLKLNVVCGTDVTYV